MVVFLCWLVGSGEGDMGRGSALLRPLVAAAAEYKNALNKTPEGNLWDSRTTAEGVEVGEAEEKKKQLTTRSCQLRKKTWRRIPGLLNPP